MKLETLSLCAAAFSFVLANGCAMPAADDMEGESLGEHAEALDKHDKVDYDALAAPNTKLAAPMCASVANAVMVYELSLPTSVVKPGQAYMVAEVDTNTWTIVDQRVEWIDCPVPSKNGYQALVPAAAFYSPIWDLNAWVPIVNPNFHGQFNSTCGIDSWIAAGQFDVRYALKPGVSVKDGCDAFAKAGQGCVPCKTGGAMACIDTTGTQVEGPLPGPLNTVNATQSVCF